MPGGGTRTFLEPDHYEAGLGQASVQRHNGSPGLDGGGAVTCSG